MGWSITSCDSSPARRPSGRFVVSGDTLGAVVDESERNRLTKNQTALLLAASDMTQSIAAAKRLETEPDGDLARALETTIAVSYMRPFTGQPPGRLPDEYLPSGDPDAEYHAELKDLRDKVYAHTDRASGRSVSVELATRDGDIVQVTFKEQWLPLPREALPGLISHFERQRDKFTTEAASIHIQLHGLGAVTKDA